MRLQALMQLLAATFVLSTIGWAEQVPFVDLSGEWRVSLDDRPDYSRLDFDDTGWQRMVLPRTGDWPRGYRWLRRTVDIPASTGTANLALTLGNVAEVYELFLNGSRIASVGEPLLSKSYIVRPRTFSIPEGAVIPGGRLTIAVRLWNNAYPGEPLRRLAAFPDPGPYVLTSWRNRPLEVDANALAPRERAATAYLIMAVVELVLAMLLLLGWLLQRERRDIAFFACYLLSRVLVNIYPWPSIAGDWPFSSNPLFSTGLALRGFFLIYFIASQSGNRMVWIKAIAWSALTIRVFVNLAETWTGEVIYVKTNNLRFVLPLLSVAVLVAAIQLLWEKARQRNARELTVIGTVAGIAFLQSQQLDFLQVVFPRLEIAGMKWPLYDILTMLFAFVTTALLIQSLSAARQRLGIEMEAARAIQQLLLGDAVSNADTCFQIHTDYVPAQEVGGDFYKILYPCDGSVIVVAGDVSGKGLKAAMLVSVAVGILSNEKSMSPKAILGALNEGLVGHTGGGFVTCCCARLDGDGTAAIANAGHPAPYCDGREVEIEAGLPLGVVAGVEYAESVVRGERFTFVSDGVVEAANAKGELFGFERTLGISGKSAREIADAAKAWGQNDDITVVTVRRTLA